MNDVDVLLPVRNGGRLLADAVESVLDQDGVELRVIVVDDGSTDGAPQRLPRDPRLLVVGGPARGTAAALNKALACAVAPYVARQDADDRSLPGRLLAEVEHLEANDGIGLVATAFEIVAGDRVVTTMGPPPFGLLDRNPLCAGSTMARRGVMATVAGYREQFRQSEDYDAWLRCAWVCGISVLPVVGYQYRLSATMATIRAAAEQEHFADLARASARARLAGAPDPAEGAVVERVATDAELAAWWAREFAALGARREAWRCVRSAARHLPARRTAGLVRDVVRPPAPQAVWS